MCEKWWGFKCAEKMYFLRKVIQKYYEWKIWGFKYPTFVLTSECYQKVQSSELNAEVQENNFLCVTAAEWF